MLFRTLLCVACSLVTFGTGVLGFEDVQTGNPCGLTLQTQTDPYHEPLFLKQITKKKKTTYDFIWPTSVDNQGVLTIQSGQKLLLGCPRSEYGNYQVTSENEEAFAVCNDGVLTINGTEVTNKTSGCYKSYANSWLNITENTCGSSGNNTGVIVQLGFQLEDGSYYPVAYSCFSVSRANTLWTHHQLMGASLAGGVKCGESHSFSRGPSSLYPNVNPASYYPEDAQKKSFDKILGTGGAAMYISSKDFLNRGHLAPHADFVFNTQRLMTYYYVNCAPQWYSFNAGNWEAVENYLRELAEQVDTTVNVWTGTYGILSLANTKGVETEIYLDPDNELIPVPLVYWKLVQNPKTKACTVTIGHNNPFLTSPPESICAEVEPTGWPNLTSKLSAGYTYYCAYKSFKKVVDYAPNIKCNGLFELTS